MGAEAADAANETEPGQNSNKPRAESRAVYIYISSSPLRVLPRLFYQPGSNFILSWEEEEEKKRKKKKMVHLSEKIIEDEPVVHSYRLN